MKDSVRQDIGARTPLQDWTTIDWKAVKKRVKNLTGQWEVFLVLWSIESNEHSDTEKAGNVRDWLNNHTQPVQLWNSTNG